MQQPFTIKQPEPMPKTTFVGAFLDFLRSEDHEGISATTTIAFSLGLLTFFVCLAVGFQDERVKGIASVAAAAIGGVATSLLKNYLKRRA